MQLELNDLRKTYLLPYRCGQGKTPTNLCRAESPPRNNSVTTRCYHAGKASPSCTKESVHLPCNWN